MILIIDLKDCDLKVKSGETFNLVYIDYYGKEDTIIKETFSKPTKITKVACFIFLDEDGSCTSPNICGFFGTDLPKELKEAKRVNDLTHNQVSNFIKTSPIIIQGY